MITNFSIQKDSTVPFLRVSITKDGKVPLYQVKKACEKETIDPNAVDLTGATLSVEIIKCGRPSVKITPLGVAEVVDAKNGIVEYKWNAADTSLAGIYYVTFIVNWGNGVVYRWPTMRESLSVEVL